MTGRQNDRPRVLGAPSEKGLRRSESVARRSEQEALVARVDAAEASAEAAGASAEAAEALAEATLARTEEIVLERLEEVFGSVANGNDLDTGLSSSSTETVSTVLAIPSWANNVVVTATGAAGARLDSSDPDEEERFSAWMSIAGDDGPVSGGTAGSTGMGANLTIPVVHQRSWSSSPPSSITVTLHAGGPVMQDFHWVLAVTAYASFST